MGDGITTWFDVCMVYLIFLGIPALLLSLPLLISFAVVRWRKRRMQESNVMDQTGTGNHLLFGVVAVIALSAVYLVFGGSIAWILRI